MTSSGPSSPSADQPPNTDPIPASRALLAARAVAGILATLSGAGAVIGIVLAIYYGYHPSDDEVPYGASIVSAAGAAVALIVTAALIVPLALTSARRSVRTRRTAFTVVGCVEIVVAVLTALGIAFVNNGGDALIVPLVIVAICAGGAVLALGPASRALRADRR